MALRGLVVFGLVLGLVTGPATAEESPSKT